MAFAEARNGNLLGDFLASIFEVRIELILVDGDGELSLGRLKIPYADFHACAPESSVLLVYQLPLGQPLHDSAGQRLAEQVDLPWSGALLRKELGHITTMWMVRPA